MNPQRPRAPRQARARRRRCRSLRVGNARAAIHSGLAHSRLRPENYYSFDISKAKRLMEEAGWTLRGGVREKGGKALNLRLYTLPAGIFPITTELVQAQLAQLGIATTISTYELSTLIQRMMRGDYDLAVFAYTWIGADPGEALKLFLSTGGGLNVSRYSSPAYDALLTRYTRSLDPNQRARLITELQVAFLRDAAWATLVYPLTGTAVQKKYQGIKIHTLTGGLILHDAYEAP